MIWCVVYRIGKICQKVLLKEVGTGSAKNADLISRQIWGRNKNHRLDKNFQFHVLLQLFLLYVWEKLHSELLQKSSHYIFWFIAKLWLLKQNPSTTMLSLLLPSNNKNWFLFESIFCSNWANIYYKHLSFIICKPNIGMVGIRKHVQSFFTYGANVELG